MAFIGTLIIAWILNLFGFGDVFIQGFKELFNMNITISSYYMIFFLAGLVIDIFGWLR